MNDGLHQLALSPSIPVQLYERIRGWQERVRQPTSKADQEAVFEGLVHTLLDLVAAVEQLPFNLAKLQCYDMLQDGCRQLAEPMGSGYRVDLLYQMLGLCLFADHVNVVGAMIRDASDPDGQAALDQFRHRSRLFAP